MDIQVDGLEGQIGVSLHQVSAEYTRSEGWETPELRSLGETTAMCTPNP